MTNLIRPSDAPKDGQRVLFFVPDGDTENLVTAVYDTANSTWLDTAGAVFDIGDAASAKLIGKDP